MTVYGNHEIEAFNGQQYNSALYTDTASTWGFFSTRSGGGLYPYQGAAARFPAGELAATTLDGCFFPGSLLSSTPSLRDIFPHLLPVPSPTICAGSLAPSTIGDVWIPNYYSQAIGPVTLIVLNSYLPFVSGTAQYTWFTTTIAAVSRTATPWLIGAALRPVVPAVPK